MTNEISDIMSDENGAANTLLEVNPVELPESKPVTELPENEERQTNNSEKEELLNKLADLEAELLKEQIKVKLLILGILPEKLEDGAAMAYGLCLAGKTPDNAANEIINAYPHFKAVRQELPQFSAESAGSGNGFSAIRKIFSSR